MPIVRPCPDSLDCPPDEPLDNFSSEGDDTLDFISTQYAYIPPTTRLWNSTSCGVTYVSNISQSDADLKASAGAQSCAPCLGSDCGQPTTTTFCNALQTPCANCPDGSLTCFTVSAGSFCGFTTQAAADQAARDFGLQQAKKHPVCISPINQCTCLGLPFNTAITANQKVSWSFTGGSFPPGLSMIAPFGTAAVITGTPTVPGTYVFAIRAENGEGGFTAKTYQITVLQITTTQLPAFSVGVPYSYQLQATGGSGSYLWKIASGTLPPGLTLSNTGVISGTPT